jgi:hypothetical protein
MVDQGRCRRLTSLIPLQDGLRHAFGSRLRSWSVPRLSWKHVMSPGHGISKSIPRVFSILNVRM